MRPTLIVTSNHTMQPMWTGLHEHYDLCIVGPQAPLAQELGLTGASPIGKYATPDAQEAAINKSYDIAAKLHDTEMAASLVSRVLEAVGNPTPDQLTEARVRQWWPAMVGERSRQSAMLVELLKSLVADRKVVGCVVHEDVTPDMRTLVMFCKGRGIPTFHIPHANCFYTGNEWDIHTESISDYIAASGTHAVGFYSKWEFDGAIKTTGAPQMDKFYNTNGLPSRAEARKVLGIGESDFAIIFATSWWQLTSARSRFDAEYNESFQQMLNAAKTLKATLVVKMHPGEVQGKEQFYMEGLKREGVNGCVLRHYNEYVLRASDVIVAHGPSNILVESAILGLPSAYFPTEGFGFSSGPIGIDSNMDAIHAIETARAVVEWDSWAQTMNDVHGRFDEGSAVERVTDFVRDICRD